MNSKRCLHGAFVVRTEVRTLSNVIDGPVVKYALDAEVASYDCGVIFDVPRVELTPTVRYLTGHVSMKAENTN